MKPKTLSQISPALKYKYSNLFMDGVSLADLAKTYGTPSYVYSYECFINPLREFQRGLKSLDPFIAFAVKANSNISVLKCFADAGAGADIVSGGELYRAQKAGFQGSKTVFSGVGKTKTEIMDAIKAGIHSFHVESYEECAMLDLIAREVLGRKSGRNRLSDKANADNRLTGKIPIVFRFNPDIPLKTHPYISTGLKKNKFGMEAKEIMDALHICEANDSCLDYIGLSIHIGSQILSLSPYDLAFSKMALLARDIEAKRGLPTVFLDCGGGLGVPYSTDSVVELQKSKMDSKAYCALALKHFLPFKKRFDRFHIGLEIGRYLSARAGILLSSVVLVRNKKAQQTNQDPFLVVDAAMNDLMRPALYQARHEIIPVCLKAKSRPYQVVGPVCESSDDFGKDFQLPTDITSGDLVALLSTGAYGFSMSGDYNSRPRAAEILIKNKKAKLIRKRETYKDLIRLEGN